MRRRLLVPLAVVALVAPGTAGGATFTLGVAAGEVRTTSAVLWARAPAGRVTLELSRRRIGGFERRAASLLRRGDGAVTAAVTGLRPGTVYFYRFRTGRQLSTTGRFETAPAATSTAPVRFAYTGDADATRNPATGAPGFNSFGVYAAMAAERNDFNVNLGDTIYSDSGVGGGPPALTVAQKWAKYRLGLALPALRRLRAEAGLYSHWDDHEFINDFTRPEHGEAIYAAGVKAFTDYSPVRFTAADGLYRTVRWGRNLELFFLDERSFRDAKARADGTCDNPATPGAPDLAPTAPGPVRAAFAQLAPSLAQPVPPACLARLRDPARTMLGARQLERFRREVTASTATWKVIVNEVPMQQFYALPYDRWEGYEAERTAVIQLLQQVRNVVVLTTDAHANLVGDIRLRTFEAPGPLESGILEVVTGPVATETYARELDETLGTTGNGPLLEALLFRPPLPRGLGMRCAATNVYSYAQVRVTATELTITPKDESGRLLRELSGNPCGPFVLTAR